MSLDTEAAGDFISSADEFAVVNDTATTSPMALGEEPTRTARFVVEVTNLSTEIIGVIVKARGYDFDDNDDDEGLMTSRRIPPGCSWREGFTGAVALGVVATGDADFSAYIHTVSP